MNGLGEVVSELLRELRSLPVHAVPGLTNYTFFLLIAFVLTLGFLLVAARKVSMIPKGIGNIAEAGVQFIRDNIVMDVMGPEGVKYVPFVGTLFFFILFNNLLGLIPGFKPGTGTMGVTVTLAVMVFIVYNAIGIRKHGAWGYLKSFYPKGVWAPIAVFVMFLEILSHFIRPLTLSVRLFANMYAGHVILGIFSIFTVLLFKAGGFSMAISALPIALQIVMYAFELFVAFIQAYLFAILTSVYIGGALHAGEH